MSGVRTVTLDISILGREFKVACKETERAELSEAVALLESGLARTAEEVGGLDSRPRISSAEARSPSANRASMISRSRRLN